jgi:hypothetical protein
MKPMPTSTADTRVSGSDVRPSPIRASAADHEDAADSDRCRSDRLGHSTRPQCDQPTDADEGEQQGVADAASPPSRAASLA